MEPAPVTSWRLTTPGGGGDRHFAARRQIKSEEEILPLSRRREHDPVLQDGRRPLAPATRQLHTPSLLSRPGIQAPETSRPSLDRQDRIGSPTQQNTTVDRHPPAGLQVVGVERDETLAGLHEKVSPFTRPERGGEGFERNLCQNLPPVRVDSKQSLALHIRHEEQTPHKSRVSQRTLGHSQGLPDPTRLGIERNQSPLTGCQPDPLPGEGRPNERSSPLWKGIRTHQLPPGRSKSPAGGELVKPGDPTLLADRKNSTRPHQAEPSSRPPDRMRRPANPEPPPNATGRPIPQLEETLTHDTQS